MLPSSKYILSDRCPVDSTFCMILSLVSYHDYAPSSTESKMCWLFTTVTKYSYNKTIEFMFTGINMFWAWIRLILVWAVRTFYYYYHFGGHWENKHWKNDNKTLWRIFFLLWVNVNKLWNGFSSLIGCLDRTIIWFSLFIGLFQRAKIHCSLPNSSF